MAGTLTINGQTTRISANLARWGAKEKLIRASGLKLVCTRGIIVLIDLEPSDTYRVQIGKIRNFQFQAKGAVDDVYADSLVQTIDGLFRAYP